MLAILSVLLAFLLIAIVAVARAYQPPSDDIPTPSLHQIFGMLFSQTAHVTRQLVAPILQKHKVMRTMNFGQWVVNVASPEAIDAVLKDTCTFSRVPIHPSFVSTILSQFSFRHLDFNDGVAWQRHKERIGLPLIAMCHNVTVFHDLMRTLFHTLDTHEDILECTKRLTLDALGRLVLGIELTTLEGNNEGLVRFFHPLETKPRAVLAPLFADQESQEQQEIEALFSGIIAHRREILAEKGNMGDILSLLLKNDAAVTDRELVHDLTTLLRAGCDTTSSALAITLFHLAKHQPLQERVYSEVSMVADTSMPSAEQVDGLKFLEAFILETLRTHPPSTIAPPRLATKDTSLCSFGIPKGTLVVPDLLALLNDPEHWPNPSEFQPERFLGSQPNLFLPFGGSEATYVGFGFGLQLQRVAVCAILQRYTIHLSDAALDFHPSFLTRPKPFRLHFAPRPQGEALAAE